MMTQGFSYRYGNSISMIVKGSLDNFYHLEYCSFKPVNGYNARGSHSLYKGIRGCAAGIGYVFTSSGIFRVINSRF